MQAVAKISAPAGLSQKQAKAESPAGPRWARRMLLRTVAGSMGDAGTNGVVHVRRICCLLG
jgi:hypothetical protein